MDTNKIVHNVVKILLILQLLVTSCSGLCNVCQTNRVACINSTSFYLCFGDNSPHMDVLYHCKEGFECTEYDAICLQASTNRPPSCDSTSRCGQCSASTNSVFACISRSRFQLCYGSSRPIGQMGDCPIGFVCDASSPAMCMNAAGPHEVTCNIYDGNSGPPTTAAPPSSSSETPSYPLTPDQVCAQQMENGLYPTMPHDPYCRRYIHCYPSNGILRGTEHTCPSTTYYNMEMEQCSLYKPAYCI